LVLGEIPFPTSWLRLQLDRSSIRAIMPASVRPTLKLVEAEPFSGKFYMGRLPAGTALLPDETVWDDYGAGGSAEWRSRPIERTGFGYWRIEMTGRPNRPGAWLRLETEDGIPLSSRIAPSRDPELGWRPVYVRVPSRARRIVLHSGDPGDLRFDQGPFSGPCTANRASSFQ